MTEEQFRKDKWLSQLKNLEYNMKSLETLKKRDQMRAEGTAAKKEKLDKGKSDSKANATDKVMIIYAETCRKYDDAVREYQEFRKIVETEIEKIKDVELRSIGRDIYLNGLSKKQIADNMYCSENTVKNKKKKLLDKIFVPF